MYTNLLLSQLAIVPLYHQICQINAAVGVYYKCHCVIEVIVPVYHQMYEANAAVGVYTKSTLVIEAIVPL